MNASSPATSLLIYNKFYGHRCSMEGCDNPVLSNALCVQTCVDHYIQRSAEFGIADPRPYDYVRPQYTLTLYADGACKHNPGPGGYGLVLLAHDADGTLIKERHVSAGVGLNATNNQAELSGALAALKLVNLKVFDMPVLVNVVCDSNYVVQGINEYIYTWMRNGWKTAAKKPVANRELWEDLWAANDNLSHRAQFVWTQAHTKRLTLDARYNAIADELASAAARTQVATDRTLQL